MNMEIMTANSFKTISTVKLSTDRLSVNSRSLDYHRLKTIPTHGSVVYTGSQAAAALVFCLLTNAYTKLTLPAAIMRTWRHTMA